MEQTVRNATRMMVLLVSPVLLLFIFIPDLILMVFGKEFAIGAPALTILAIGQFVNVATGSVGYLLMMTGNESLLRNNLFFCTLLCITLNILFVPVFDIIGAAVAAAVTVSLLNSISVVIAWKKLSIITLPFRIKRDEIPVHRAI